ncbi:MAG: hypothetical protein U1F42_03915 [Candidatus Competibacteraceae bacterium]
MHTERGNGDALQIRPLPATGGATLPQIAAVCPEPLRALLGTVAGVSTIRLPGTLPADSFDLYCPLLSLPRVLNFTLDNLPLRFLTSAYRRILSCRLPNAGRFKVGLAWSWQRRSGKRDRQRSCPLSELLPLFTLPSIAFYSLQVPVTAADAALLLPGVHNLEPELSDYARTAAYVHQLDFGHQRL